MKTLEPLLHANEVCQILIDGSHAFVRTVEGTILSWTEGAGTIYGWTEQEALGQESHTLLRTIFPKPLASINEQLRSEGRWTGELIHTGKRGNTIVVQSSWKLISGDHGNPEYVVELNNEITELTQARQRLSESEHRLRVAKEVANLGIWDWNTVTDTLLCSEEWFAQHGRTPTLEGPTYKEWLTWVHPDDRVRVAGSMREGIEGATVYNAELRVVWPDGSIRWLQTKARSIADDEGKCLRMIGANMDVTDRKNLEEQLQAINQSLERSNQDLQQFAFTVGHDLKEPLRAVSTFSALISKRLRDTLDLKHQEYLAYIEEGAKRMHKMIDSHLEYSRSVAQAMPVQLTDMQIVVGRAIANLQTAIEESDAEIAVRPLPQIFANADVLTNIFQNLVGNAIKYRQPGERPQILISATQSSGEWVFAVLDNGVGLDADSCKSIFELFKRGNSTASGSGIGLAISKRFIERHGGRIWAESEQGRGSTFYFSLPIRPRQTTSE